MKSLSAKLKQLGAMADTKDLNVRENDFVKNVVRQTGDGTNTTTLTSAQVEWIERLHEKNFSDG